ncbi:PadR family transcriptional regulator [Gordonia jinhuaensis]|uniref:PadR family transcriptional regulator n=1 Tax=Gordonia jinhuaensis TaxID=1517702 RepID=A0A916STV3_9ACTN|nr:PadR family transcriptional regulator [Gordonia jinhuaensis]GGB16242.1 PadR family transcriptional regulator [Gordonia jinhuaensis]
MECSRGGLNPLSVLVLGLLNERSRMHPYEMVQTLIARHEDRFANVRPGSLYHAVDRLTEMGLIRVADVERQGNRPERTLYETTDAGVAAMTDRVAGMLASSKQEYPELFLAVAQAHELDRRTVLEMLAQRLDAMRSELDDITGARHTLLAAGKPELFYLDLGVRITTLTAQIGWLEELVEAMSTGAMVWTDDPDFRAGDLRAQNERAPDSSSPHPHDQPAPRDSTKG